MLAAEDLRLAEETVRDLRAQGQEARARALEAVLAVATAAQAQPSAPTVADYLTPSQAARMLRLRVKTVQDWIKSGQLPVEHRGGQTLIRREALLQYLDDLASQSPELHRPSPSEAAAIKRRQEYVLGGLPQAQLARLEALHDKMEANERLTRAERAEMVSLERMLITAAGQRLEEWTRQSQSGRS
ncbi:MAG TPA: helix-turn-helix domain-containing protein [Chloroflexota bacterium]|nr:helix-turn-helix domain-containing protein [Chloroflexota bacterium]